MPDEDVAFKDLNQKHNDYQFGLWIDMQNIKICEICLALIQ
jgi:hypothetical protein